MAERFDTGTLSWVKDEIDLALEQAGVALARHAASSADGTALAEARAHLHQAVGALTLVGLTGVARCAETLEAQLARLAENMEAQSSPVSIVAAAGTLLNSLRRYLDNLMAGHPDQPLRLYPALSGLVMAAGETPPAPDVLFFPDLGLRAPRPPDAPPPPAPMRLKALRLGYARGRAKWRNGEARGLTEMKNAVASLAQGLANPEALTPAWVALAWFETPVTGTPAEENLFDGLDRWFEQEAAGMTAAADPDWLKGLLYAIAMAPPSGNTALESVRAAYRLADLIPAAAAAETRRTACQAPLTTAMAEWERFAAGQAIALVRFHDVAQLLSAAAAESRDASLARLTAAIVDFAVWLRRQPERADAPLALELAGALVLVEEALEHEGARSPDDEAMFSAAVAQQIERLSDLKPPGARPRSLTPLPWRERRLEAQVAREIGQTLAGLEAVLEPCLQSGQPAAVPDQARDLLHHVTGAFALLDAPAAVQLAQAGEACLAAGAAAPLRADESAILATRLTTLARYADARQHGQNPVELLAPLIDAAATQPVSVVPPPAAPEPAPPESVCVGTLTLSATLYRLYVDEARDHVASLRRELGAAAGTPSRELIRAAHTLAGISAGIGISTVQALAHALENALVRHSLVHTAPDEDARMLIGRAAGALEGMVGVVAERRLPVEESSLATALNALAPVSPVVSRAATDRISPLAERRQSRPDDEIDAQLAPIFLEEADEQVHQLEAEAAAWRAAPADAEIGRRLARLLHTFKGGARMCGAMGLGELAHSMETRIEQALAGDGASAGMLAGLDTSFARAHALLDEVRAAALATNPAPVVQPAVPLPVPARAAPAAPEPAGAAVLLRVRADLVDRLVADAGELAISRSRIEGEIRAIKSGLLDLADNVMRLKSQLREFELHAETSMQSRLGGGDAHQRAFDPLELDRFTRLQELTRMMTESVSDVATVQHALLRQADGAHEAVVIQSRQQRELSHALLRARMVPFATVAERLHRVVRQTAKELGRQANLDVRGGEAPVDRHVLERMLGPLEHLLRNAVAHGIEDPAARQQAGKPALGQIVLSITAGDNDIRLALADDGRGLDLAAIRQRAVERGLLDATAPAGDAALAEFIFRAGFSTAATVNEIAGRGVGLDVVRDEVTQLGGRVTVGAAHGGGTQFDIALPLTLALIPVMLVSAAQQTWAIPAALVEEARELTLAEAASRQAAGGLTRNGRYYAWRTLAGLYGLADPAPPHWQVLLRQGDQALALAVDVLGQNQEVVVKPPAAQLKRVPGLTGATVLPDGRVALIVNPLLLPGRAPAPPTAVMSAPTFDHAATVMVVDDSLTVRKITGRLLERAGYRVATAKDGEDALAQIRARRPDILLADIEMPRMDGFALVRALRDDAALADLPVIMITSRSAGKHRQVAAELGVRHYLGKPYDEDELLGLIAGFLK